MIYQSRGENLGRTSGIVCLSLLYYICVIMVTFRCERRGNGGGKGLGSKDVWDQLHIIQNLHTPLENYAYII